MEDVVAVRGCSHTGGHKYAGNVLIFLPEEGRGTFFYANHSRFRFIYVFF